MSLSPALIATAHVRSGSEFVIELASQKLTSLDGLDTLLDPKIRSLNVSFNALKTLPALPRGSDLRELLVGQNVLIELPALAGARRLERVVASANRLRALCGAFRDVRALKVLHLDGNAIESLSGLSECVSLVELDISNNCVSSLGDVPLRRLEVLRCGGNAALDLAQLAGRAAPALRELAAPHCALRDLRALDGAPALSILDVAGNAIVSISAGLRDGFPVLSELLASRCLLTALPRDSRMLFPVLEILDVSHNAIATEDALQPLTQCAEALAEVFICGNPLCAPRVGETIEDAAARMRSALFTLAPQLEVIDGVEINAAPAAAEAAAAPWLVPHVATRPSTAAAGRRPLMGLSPSKNLTSEAESAALAAHRAVRKEVADLGADRGMGAAQSQGGSNVPDLDAETLASRDAIARFRASMHAMLGAAAPAPTTAAALSEDAAQSRLGRYAKLIASMESGENDLFSSASSSVAARFPSITRGGPTGLRDALSFSRIGGSKQDGITQQPAQTATTTQTATNKYMKVARSRATKPPTSPILIGNEGAERAAMASLDGMI